MPALAKKPAMTPTPIQLSATGFSGHPSRPEGWRFHQSDETEITEEPIIRALQLSIQRHQNLQETPALAESSPPKKPAWNKKAKATKRRLSTKEK